MYNDHQHQHPSTSFNIHGLFPQLSSLADTSAWSLLRRIPSSNSWAVDVRSQLPPTSLLVSTSPVAQQMPNSSTIASGCWFQPTPLKKYEFVSWDDDIQYTKIHVPNHQPGFIKWRNLPSFSWAWVKSWDSHDALPRAPHRASHFFVGPGRGLIFFSKSLGTSPASEKGISFENPKIDTYEYLPNLPIHPSIYPNWPDPPLFLSGHPRNKIHRLGPFQLYINKT